MPARFARVGLALAMGVAHPALAGPSDGDTSIALGRAVFVEKCAKCHDENASRPLPDGRSLVERLSQKPDLAVALAGRLKTLPEEKRRAVVAYVATLLPKQGTAQPGKGP